MKECTRMYYLVDWDVDGVHVHYYNLFSTNNEFINLSKHLHDSALFLEYRNNIDLISFFYINGSIIR